MAVSPPDLFTSNGSSSAVAAHFLRNFLQSLQSLSRRNPQATHRTRCRKIKLAAYASMASASGGNHLWSRALLWKIRSRASLHRFPNKSSMKHREFRAGRRLRNEVEEVEELRKIVPGGDAMDMCCLLEETAHYIQCLALQVEIMKNIADCFSSSK